jgi:hypothetical protein
MSKPERKQRRVVSKDRVNEALTLHLRALSVLEDNEEVTSFYKVPEGLDVKIEVVNDN